MFKLEFKIGDTVVNKTADNENEVRPFTPSAKKNSKRLRNDSSLPDRQ